MKRIFTILLFIIIISSGKVIASFFPDFFIQTDTTTENTHEASFYPNPVTVEDNFTIESSHKIKTVDIYNVIGQLVQHEDNIDLTKKMQINLKFSEKGMYLVKITSLGNTIHVKRLLIE